MTKLQPSCSGMSADNEMCALEGVETIWKASTCTQTSDVPGRHIHGSKLLPAFPPAIVHSLGPKRKEQEKCITCR